MWRVLLAVVAGGLGAVAGGQEPDPPAGRDAHLEDITKAIGQPMDSAEVRAVVRPFKEIDPVVHFPSWQSNQPLVGREVRADYRWPTKGFELAMVREDVNQAQWLLHTVWMYGQRVRGYTRYRSPLPSGLLFGESRLTVEKALGRPTRDVAGKSAEPWQEGGSITHAVYQKTGVAVSYLEHKGKEPVVAAVGLFAPGIAPTYW